jgi:hypothetical protein
MKSANDAKVKSGTILNEFNNINNSLKNSSHNDSLQSRMDSLENKSTSDK